MKIRVRIFSTLIAGLFLLMTTTVSSSIARGGRARSIVDDGVRASHREAQILRSYPEPGSVSVPIETSVGITASKAYLESDATDRNLIVTGSRSGVHRGHVKLSFDGTTIIFSPLTSFDLSESVLVTLSARTVAQDGQSESPLTYSFRFTTITSVITAHGADQSCAVSEESFLEHGPASTQGTGMDHTLDLPQITITVDDTSATTAGSILMSSFGGGFPNSNLMVLNDHGGFIRTQAVPPGPGLLFCKQPNGEYTYMANGLSGFQGLDTTFKVIDTFNSVNTYQADGHELLVNADGSYCILADSHSTRGEMGLQGGDATYVVIGNVIQTFDAGHNLVFEWRGIDFFKPAEAVHENLAGQSVDFEHMPMEIILFPAER